MPFEWLLVAFAVAVAIKVIGVQQRGAVWLMGAMLLTGGLLGLGTRVSAPARPPQPIARERGDFASSSSCRSCHPSEHASWHASYHRRMTQSAELANVASPELRTGARLGTEVAGQSVALFSRQGELWARLPDPSLTSAAPSAEYERLFRAAPEQERRVQLLTGSHHQQAFWVAGARAGDPQIVPAVYLIAEGRLIPRRDAFLSPPEGKEHAVRWNSNCIQCHSVAGAPEHDASTDRFTSSAAELGIACEACHGAGTEHVREMQNPLRRYLARGQDADLKIVDPLEPPAARASEVCGRCHSYFFPKDPDGWWTSGFSRSFRPGQELANAQLLLSPEVLQGPDAPHLDEAAESLIYADGTIRVGGREYNGLVRSPCFERGEGKRQLSCLSCHSLHESAPEDQLAQDKSGNGACASCHEEQRARLSEHTRHSASSSGSLCYNCHMPHTTYALLGAMRSHRIDSPSFDQRTRDRPNACSLCHLERSEAWAADKAADMFGAKAAYRLSRAPGLGAADVPAAAVFSLAGDAAVRAVTAAALERVEGPGPELALRRQLLGELAEDPYAAVRFVARRSLQALPPASGASTPPLSPALVSKLKGLRDDRPVTIAE